MTQPNAPILTGLLDRIATARMDGPGREVGDHGREIIAELLDQEFTVEALTASAPAVLAMLASASRPQRRGMDPMSIVADACERLIRPPAAKSRWRK